MTTIHTVRLELLRPGPSHNQLLSPLTPYIALCGNCAPTTLYIGHEHHRFLNKLERLRYVISQNGQPVAVPDHLREAAVAELGSDVSGILGAIPSLLGEVSRAGGSGGRSPSAPDRAIVHLSFVLGGSELALIPFELAIAPQAFPGEGLELGLQLAAAIVPTRETRRMLPEQLPWNGVGRPKLLLVSAAPGGLDVPLPAHVHAIREAFEPWIAWPKRSGGQDGDRLDEVKKHIRLLNNASIEAIYRACAEDAYSHVHILAHGGAYEHAGERQFGLVLCADGDPARAEIVSGKRLARALRAETSDGARRSQPMVVTLATCDSGNQSSVLVPGGSLAHDLHGEGIPWVFASQYPLTKTGSVQMAQALYPGLLRGDDPRQVLFELRRRLYMHSGSSHDWASIVAYATVPPDFERCVTEFFEQQSRAAIEVCLGRADDLVDSSGDPAQIRQALGGATRVLDRWRERLPGGDGLAARERRAECYGMHGSTYKRMALIEYKRAGNEPVPPARPDSGAAEAARRPAEGDRLLRTALGHYRQAMAESALGRKFHWVATQTLSLSAALNDAPDLGTFELAWHMAQRDLRHPDAGEQAWAHGTLAELEMIGLHHKAQARSAARGVQARVVGHCRQVLALMGPRSFHVDSTRRQFQRYIDHWTGDDAGAGGPPDPRRAFRPIAQAAVAALTEPPTA